MSRKRSSIIGSPLVGRALFPLAALVAAAGLAAPAPARAPRPRAKAAAPARGSRPRPPVRPTSPRVSHFRQPGKAEMAQLNAVLRREGWPGAVIATVPTGYTRSGAAVEADGSAFATLYGDVDGDQQAEWVVGCYVPSSSENEPEGSGAKPPASTLHDDRARIVVFKKNREGAWDISWRSPGLGHEFGVPDFNLLEVQDGLDRLENLLLPFSLVDIDANRTLEIAYHCKSQSPAVGALPGIYRFAGGRWVSVAPQADRFSLRNLDRDPNLELVTGTRYVGYGQGDDDVPRVWRWSGQQYREASKEFPLFYHYLFGRYTAYVEGKKQRGEEFNRSSWDRAIRKVASLGPRL